MATGKRKLYIILSAVMISSLLLGACSPGSAPDAVPEPTPESPPSPPPAPSANNETLIMKRMEFENLMQAMREQGKDVSAAMNLAIKGGEAAESGNLEEGIRLLDEAIAMLKSSGTVGGEGTAVQAPTGPEEFKDWLLTKMGPDDWRDIGYEVPSWQELDELKAEIALDRKYPDKIKGLFDPGPITNTIDLLYFNDELKDLGINTYFVIAEYELAGDSIYQFYLGYSEEVAERAMIHRMLLAKKEGYAVIFVPDYPSLFDIGKQNYNLDVLEAQLEAVALKWAMVAEEYQLEYFAPINEYEHLMFSNDYDLGEIYTRTRAFYDRITPQIREIYTGKVVYKFGNLGPWDNFKDVSAKGADLFGVGNAYTYDPSSVGSDVRSMVQTADEIAVRDGVPWFISEFLVFRASDLDPQATPGLEGNTDGVTPDFAERYRAGLDAFNDYAENPAGFAFMSWTGTGMVRDTGAVPLLKEFFAGLK